MQVRTFTRERVISGEITPLQFLCAQVHQEFPDEPDSESDTEDDNSKLQVFQYVVYAYNRVV